MDTDRIGTRRDRPCLLLTDDAALRAEVLRVAAAADCVVVERDLPVGKISPSMRLEWEDAGVVLVDGRAGGLSLPRRARVAVVVPGAASVDHWRLATVLGASDVMELPSDDSALVALLSAEPGDSAGDGGVITVTGATGGAGASTLAAAIALTASSRDIRTLLVDGDEYGAGMDLLLGWESSPGLRWPGLIVEAGRISGDALRGALPTVGHLSVLSAGSVASRTPGAGHGEASTSAVVDAGRRIGDLVVCDAPRTIGSHSDIYHDAADLVVLVVTATLASVSAAENASAYLSARNSNVGLVVRGPAPGGLRSTDIADALSLPLLASMRPEPGLARRVERGGLTLSARSPLRRAASDILETFARKPRQGRRAA
ncbi:hypothetical protein CH293_13470 [Rhodococcus sp. 14-2470-1b]|uniref:septum site-determining protein Ssd n=1 Tax=Rhodococcus sp. 14-2470-1b TaxID=2023149 RepID=UPI000B9AB2FA|nr:septum site-determining protein Ssd [Rhodococcus sp. 14-2470-1b]OZF52355.1 hypothetical protein CH293_13470 [Rhodococcus sp. 14-2470-1b]